MQPGFTALAVPQALEPLWQIRSMGKKTLLLVCESSRAGSYWIAEPGFLPGTPGDTCLAASQHSAFGWTWLPAHACIPPLRGCPARQGHSLGATSVVAYVGWCAVML